MIEPRWLVALAVACRSTSASPAHSLQHPSVGTTADLVAVSCEARGVFARDRDGHRHALGPPPALHGETFRVADNGVERSSDGASITIHPPEGAAPYGHVSVLRVAVAGPHLFALGRFVAVSNSLEDLYGFVARSDDHGTTWSYVWTGPNKGPMGPHEPARPDIGTALIALPDGTLVAIAGVGDQLWVSSDGGHHFETRPTHAPPIVDLAVSPGGTVWGVGAHGAIVTSRDGARTFEAVASGTVDDLVAIAACENRMWIVGARGTVIHD